MALGLQNLIVLVSEHVCAESSVVPQTQMLVLVT